MRAWLFLLLTMFCTPARSSQEYAYLMGVAEDFYESFVTLCQTLHPQDGRTRALEARANELAERLRKPAAALAPGSEEWDVRVAIVPSLDSKMTLHGFGKILADRAYAESLSDAALAAAIAHELGHLAHEHQKRRLTLGLALLGDDPPDRLRKRVNLAMSLSDSDVESRRHEVQADEFAIHLLRAAGLPPQALIEALSVLLRLSGPEQQLQQRIDHVRAILDTPAH
jgi:Zn-dependent protease with chaperone function